MRTRLLLFLAADSLPLGLLQTRHQRQIEELQPPAIVLVDECAGVGRTRQEFGMADGKTATVSQMDIERTEWPRVVQGDQLFGIAHGFEITQPRTLPQPLK